MVLARTAGAASAAVLIALGAVACSGEPDAPESQAPPPAVEAVAIRPAAGGGEIRGDGVIARQREAQLSFRIPGVITRLSVDEGAVVRRGQDLAQIDPAQVEAGRLQAEAALERARRDLIRDEQLYDQGFVSRARLDDRRSALKAAEAAYRAAVFDRRWASLTAPVSGVVLRRTAEPGQVVQPGQAVLTVADAASPLIVRAPVPDREAARLAAGMAATVVAGGRELAGRVILVGAAANRATGTVDVEVAIPSAPGLVSGQTAAVRIAAPAEDAAPGGWDRAPAEAILEARGERAHVLVFDPRAGVARRRPVAFGGFDGDDALLRGLPPGTRVITAGAGFVSDGDRVQVVDAAALARARAEAPAQGAGR